MASEERALMEAAKEISRLRNDKLKVLKEHEKEMEQFAYAATSAVTATALGYVEGRFPARAQMMGIPISGIAAFGLLGLGLSGYAGDEKTTNAVLAAGAGAASGFGYAFGKKKGAASAAPATPPGP